MKIIGKNSLSQYISYLLFVLFVLLTIKYTYELIGYSVSYYNVKTGNHILPDLFITGKDVGWSRNQWTIPMDNVLKFKFYVPFTQQNLITGIFNTGSVLRNILSGLFIVLFFYSSYKIFKEISKENVFNLKALVWLKRFGWLNIIFTVMMVIINFINVKELYAFTYSGISFLFFGGLLLFVVEFFKKGLELQNQADLTI
ncbi:hypothetical protein QFZ37_001053 [Chryseobacterium ginsenosidimutans]|uniref:DUF2975 domain-containing protein n=1 Tax=Chryseobacterium ginsenosidimutans TaxID=687846 RepID=UPI002787C4B2|nr:DUF2975 domain-containing protein [Chryseobacterium ginsenosidimutans]MDQ0592684.1 hypothetical protein [Chryseobacterium ginsenosidimutans]